MRRDSRLSRFLSVLLSVALVVSLNVPMTAFADEVDETNTGTTATSTQTDAPEVESTPDGGDGVEDVISTTETEEVKTEENSNANAQLNTANVEDETTSGGGYH